MKKPFYIEPIEDKVLRLEKENKELSEGYNKSLVKQDNLSNELRSEKKSYSFLSVITLVLMSCQIICFIAMGNYQAEIRALKYEKDTYKRSYDRAMYSADWYKNTLTHLVKWNSLTSDKQRKAMIRADKLDRIIFEGKRVK